MGRWLEGRVLLCMMLRRGGFSREVQWRRLLVFVRRGDNLEEEVGPFSCDKNSVTENKLYLDEGLAIVGSG